MTTPAVRLAGARELREARRLIESHGLRFEAGCDDFAGIYEEERLAPWFLTSELFVYPGAIGLSLLHAFGYGLPVITHDNLHHQMPEIAALESGRNGLLYREGDAADLARQIRRAGTDESWRRLLAHEARRTVAEVYTLDAMVARFVAAVRCASEESRQRASR